MTTKHRLTDAEALAIVEDDSTVWGAPRGNEDADDIRAMVRLRHRVDAMVDEAVIRGRRNGLPWVAIGDALGVSAEAARKKYNARSHETTT